MRENRKYLPVNWIDGMKINKNHFIEQDHAFTDGLQEMVSLNISPLRFGVLPASSAGENSFSVKISLDNQDSLRVSVLSCQAITIGGARISIPLAPGAGEQAGETAINKTFPFAAAGSESAWWIFLLVNPFERQPVGSPDLSENPPRLPFVVPVYNLKLVSESNYRQYANHPYAMPIGRVAVNGNDIRVEDNYIPPCINVSAHPDLLALLGELDKYLADLEMYASQIVQKIYVKKQQNEISELVMFLCDRVMLYLGQAITGIRWKMAYEPPVEMFICIATLARVMKNAIDLRIGSGKEELMTYLSEWCAGADGQPLKQGELETMLGNMANASFTNNDIDRNIRQVAVFVKTTLRLFETLSKLEFIGKRKESGIFVKEETAQQPATAQQPPRRRFFG